MSGVAAFLCHPRLYRAGDDGTFTAPDTRPYTGVRGVQDTAVAGEHYPNKATSWARRNFAHVCAANVALRSGDELLTVDLLLRNLDTPPLDKAAGGFTAVFVVFSGGRRALYERALRYVRRVRAVAEREYGFAPGFLLLHITGSGVLRRRWV
jgi:hypothetical protein